MPWRTGARRPGSTLSVTAFISPLMKWCVCKKTHLHRLLPWLVCQQSRSNSSRAPRIFWSRAKAQWGMVKSWQVTGANDETLGTKSGKYQGTNGILKSLRSKITFWSRHYPSFSPLKITKQPQKCHRRGMSIWIKYVLKKIITTLTTAQQLRNALI